MRKVFDMISHFRKVSVAGVMTLWLGGLLPAAQAVFPVYFNVNFENETLGSQPGTNGFVPLPTASRFTLLDIEPDGVAVVTNNLFGNSSKFALLTSTGISGTVFFTGDVHPDDQPTNGLLRVALQIASSTLLNTTNWLPITFSGGGDVTLDFRQNGAFHLLTAGGLDLDIGQYEAGKFTNVEFHIDLDTRRFSFITGTNILLANLPVGGQQGDAFVKIEPGPAPVNLNDSFGIDNVVVEIIPEPHAAVLLAAAAPLLAASLRRRRRSGY